MKEEKKQQFEAENRSARSSRSKNKMENCNNSRTTRAVTGKIKRGHCHKTHVILSPASITINHHPLRAAHSESDPFLQCNFCSYYLRTPLEKV